MCGAIFSWYEEGCYYLLCEGGSIAEDYNYELKLWLEQRVYSHEKEWDKLYRFFFYISHFQTDELENSQVCFSLSYISD